MESGDVEIARDLAMHIAAMSPRFLDAKAVSADAIDSERKIIEAIVAQEQIDAKAESDKLAGALAEMDAEKQNGVYAGLSDDEKKRSEEHTSELQSLMRISYAVFCLKKKNNKKKY